MSNVKKLHVVLLDDIVLHFDINKKTFGRDILEKVCQTRGIWEQDYFSLQHLNSGGELRWLNNRNPLLPQLMEENLGADNFTCQLRVKFFVPPQQVLITLTKHLFYLDIKKRLGDDSIRIPTSQQKVKILSCIAQAELGDFQPDCDLDILYRTVLPCYTESVFEDLKRSHAMLRLTTKCEAENLLLAKVSQFPDYGVEKHNVYTQGIPVMSLQICMENVYIALKEQPDRCIPFRNFISARVNNTNLHVVVEDFPHKNLLLTNDQSDSEIQTSTRPNPGTGTGTNTLSDVCLPFTNADQCWHAYRALTERIVFYSRQRADDIENPHFKCRWHSFVAKVQPSRAPHLRLYNFDVEHTRRETYQSTWDLLATDIGDRNTKNKRVTCGVSHISCSPWLSLGNRRSRRNAADQHSTLA